MKSISILSIPVHSVRLSEATNQIGRFIATGNAHQVVTVNPEFIVAAGQHKEFRQVLQQADLSVADGAGIVWAARFLGTPLPERVTGVDLTHALARLAIQKNWTFYFLGGQPGVAELAAERLKKIYLGLRVVGAESGGIYNGQADCFDQADEMAALIGRIKKTKPDILLVAFGAPKQDLFIARHKAELCVPVMIGVGGTFDYFSGKVRRAPLWLQQLSLEWFWRLMVEPQRFKRIFTSVVIFPWQVVVSHFS